MTDLAKQLSDTGICAALARLQADLPKIVKNKQGKIKGQNRQGDKYEYSYQYADYADVAGLLFPKMAAQGLAFSAQPTWNPELGKFGLAYQLLHTSGEVLDGFYPIETRDMSPQQVGSAITYARRYSLSAVTGVAAEEDDDAQAAQHGPQPVPEDRSRLGDLLASRQAGYAPYGDAEDRPEGINPEVQSLADLAFKMVRDRDGGATVTTLQEMVYNPARAHRGWLTAQAAHPLTGEQMPLSSVIRDAKAELEKQAAEAMS